MNQKVSSVAVLWTWLWTFGFHQSRKFLDQLCRNNISNNTLHFVITSMNVKKAGWGLYASHKSSTLSGIQSTNRNKAYSEILWQYWNNSFYMWFSWVESAELLLNLFMSPNSRSFEPVNCFRLQGLSLSLSQWQADRNVTRETVSS